MHIHLKNMKINMWVILETQDVLAFYTKNLTTGEGGMIICNNNEIQKLG